MRVACPVCGKPRPEGGFCEHPELARPRASASERGYDSTWAKKRSTFLWHHPYCILCGKKSEVADHDPVSREELIRRGVADPDDPRHLKAKCKLCHAKKGRSHYAKFTQDPA